MTSVVGFIDEGSKSDYRGGLGEGHAVFVFTDGKTYDGEWVDNEMEGQGTMHFPTALYKGGWKGGKVEGQGTYNWASGSTYDGEWKEGKKHGECHLGERIRVERSRAALAVVPLSSQARGRIRLRTISTRASSWRISARCGPSAAPRKPTQAHASPRSPLPPAPRHRDTAS